MACWEDESGTECRMDGHGGVALTQWCWRKLMFFCRKKRWTWKTIMNHTFFSEYATKNAMLKVTISPENQTISTLEEPYPPVGKYSLPTPGQLHWPLLRSWRWRLHSKGIPSGASLWEEVLKKKKKVKKRSVGCLCEDAYTDNSLRSVTQVTLEP